MKIIPRLLSVAALSVLTVAPAFADSVMTIFTGQDASACESFNLDDIGKVTFADATLSVFGEEATPTKTFDLSTVCKITFSTDGSGISSLPQLSGLRLRQNPVSDHISFDGAVDASSAVLFDLSGRSLIRLDNWSGEDIDVSAIPSGTYLLKTISQTFKVIKK